LYAKRFKRELYGYGGIGLYAEWLKRGKYGCRNKVVFVEPRYHYSFRPRAEVPFRRARQLSKYKGKGASASWELLTEKRLKRF